MSTPGPDHHKVTQDLLESCATGDIARLRSALTEAASCDPLSIPPAKRLLRDAARYGQADLIRYMFANLPEFQKDKPWWPAKPSAYEESQEFATNEDKKWGLIPDGTVTAAIEGANPAAVFAVYLDYGMKVDYWVDILGPLLSVAVGPLLSTEVERSLELVKLLLDQGADPNVQDYKGKWAIALAAGMSTPDMISLLVDNGASIHGKNVLRGPVVDRNLANVDRLLELGIDINEDIKDMDWTKRPAIEISRGNVLHCAIREKTFKKTHISLEEMVEYLLDRGVDSTIVDWEGKTPLQLAREKGEINLTQLLEQRSP
ncbi:ankyrin repeat-containing domain protein [Talaromyces proteolyticus]|uniref:Ankyrin repeat-containing domain protein n=1 Tax=Talaromyces proteolyticus TaxID=1131652 RepID=A0AAD4KPP3_9EURO|nr:ankyrin repeat-containing domain protein [Talaromyces proteolyticus]KAH8696564.1 ankyrin repeat-containing domain protein [Talaromyces proteolyticus]